MIEGTILTDQYLYQRDAKRAGEKAAKEAQKLCEQTRKRMMVTIPAELEAQAKELINKLRANYDAEKMESASKEAEAKFLRTTSFDDWHTQRSIDFWSTR